MIKLVDVWHHYGVRPVLKGVSMRVAPGELVAVMGPNGMGKSTLLGLMGGILHPIKGHVEIDGKVRRSSVENEIAIRKKVVYLPADPFLPTYCSGREFVLAVGRLYGVDEIRLMEHTDRLLQVFDLAEKGDADISSYSTGQQKKIGICAALATEAPVMILDEPFSGGLDSSALLALSRILKQLADRQDVTVVMAAPVPELVEGLAHKIAIVAHGEIVAYGPVEELRRQAQCEGALAEVLEQLMHPDVVDNIDQYLAGRSQ